MGRGSKSRNRKLALLNRRPQPLTTSGEPVGAETAVGMTVRHTSMAMSSYSGPTPPVEILEGYERIAPGSAKQILDQFIKQSDHRMNLEKSVVQSDIYRSWGGLVAGLLIALAFLGSGTALIFNGHDTAGATLATASLAGIVSVFVIGTSSQRRERQQKAKLMADAKKHR